jgi:hypothetical protein
MSSYIFKLTEVNEYTFEVEADSREEAEAMAWEQWDNGDVFAMNLNLDMEQV